MIAIPSDALVLLEELNRNGYEAYVVGGCVRDSLLGLTPKDWDICTSALPDEIKDCFSGYHLLETGIRHGTVTVRLNQQSYEITTFRTDGEYLDFRHPKKVSFVKDIRSDLARRDFTVNAMAYHPQKGLVDYFGGQADLKDKRLRCVGEAEVRFQEDALRIMRALRFSGVYGFSIEEESKKAIFSCRSLLKNIAVERLTEELKKLLLSRYADSILLEYAEVFGEWIPELKPMFHFNQQNPHHKYDVWTHAVISMKHAPNDVILRLTMLLHDIAKPQVFSLDEKGIGHFYSHADSGAKIVEAVLKRLRFDNQTVYTVTELVAYHDREILPNKKAVKRVLSKIGEEQFLRLLYVKLADGLATVHPEKSREEYTVLSEIFHQIQEVGECFSLKNLCVNGNDLKALGINEGKKIGIILQKLLENVIENQVENERDQLLEYIKNISNI